MARTEYSDEFKAEAVALAEALGDISRAAEELDMPYSTLYGWVRKGVGNTGVPSDLQDEKRQAISDRLEGLIHKILDIAPDKADDADFKALLTALGIAVDKVQLLRGEATEIRENRNIEHVRADIQRKLHRVADAQRN